MASQRRPRFAADLSQCLFDFVIQLLPPHDELHVKENVRLLLQRLIRNIEPTSRLLAFGSTANGFSLRNSDMDLCCLIDSPERLNPSDLVTMLGDLLERETRFHVKPLPHARIPIVKLSLDPSPGLPSGIACDIGFENRLAIENTRLLLTYAKIDPTRVRTLVLFLKIWSKRRKINSPYKGTLSSYGYVLLVIYFLVHVKNPPVLPNLQQMPPLRPINKDETTLNGYNVWFFDDTDILCQRWQSENTESVAELLIDFFRYFSRDFLYNTGVASIRAGLLKKDVKGWQNDLSPTSVRYDPARERNRFCIEDPFETDYNVARCVTKDGLYTIRGEFMRASRILSMRPERAIMALAELCEERKEEDLVSAPSHGGHHHIPYVGNGGGHAAKLSIPPQTPYSIGTQSRSSFRVTPTLSPRLPMTAGSNSILQVVDEDSILTTTETNDNPPMEPVNVPLPPSPSPSPLLHSPTIASATSTSNTIPPIVNNTTNATKPLSIASPLPSFSNTIPNFVPPSTIPDRPHPEHMAPRRFKWTSPPPADASFVDRTMYENSLDRSLELATAPIGEARETYRYKKRKDGQEFTRWEDIEEGEVEMEMEEEDDDVGSVVETLSEVGSVRSFTEGMHFGSNANAMMNFGYSGVGMRGFSRRPSWHVMDSLPRGWVPPAFVPSSNALKQLSQQQGEQEVDGVGSPTPTRNGFSHQQSSPPLSQDEGGEMISQDPPEMSPESTTTPSSTSPTAISAGQPSPPIPFRPPVSYPTPSSPYTRRSRPPSQQQQQQQHTYRHQNRGGYNGHQPNQRSPLIPFYDSPESVSSGVSSFESMATSPTATTSSNASVVGGNGRFSNGGYFGLQKGRGEGGLCSPSSPRVAQSPRFYRHHQQNQQNYQHRNAYGGNYSSSQQQQQRPQQQQPRSPQSPGGLPTFDSYALHLAMNNLNVINSLNSGLNTMNTMGGGGGMNAMNVSPMMTNTNVMMDGGTGKSKNGNGNGNGGTTVYYQTTTPRSPRNLVSMQGGSSNNASPKVGVCSSMGSGATSPGGGVEENVLSPSLPSIGLLRHGQRNGWNGINAMEMVCGRGNGSVLLTTTTTRPVANSGVYASSAGYQQLMMAASLRGSGIINGGGGGRRNGVEEERVGGNCGEEEEFHSATTTLTSPVMMTSYLSKTPVQGVSVMERNGDDDVDDDDDDDDDDGDLNPAAGGDGCANSVGSTSSSSNRSSTATDVTTATTAMTGLSSSPPGIVLSAETSLASSSPLTSPSGVAVNGGGAVNRPSASASASASASTLSAVSYSTKAKGKARNNKSRINGAGGGKAKSKSRSPSPFVKASNGSAVPGGPLPLGLVTVTAKITKEEEERFHSGVVGVAAGAGAGAAGKSGGGGGGEEKVGGRGKKNGGGEREKKSGNGKVKTNGSVPASSSTTTTTTTTTTKNGGNSDTSNSKGRGKQKGKQRRGGNGNNNKKGGDQGAEKPAVASTSTSGIGHVAGNSS